jgi:hypothetical protein
MRITLHTQQRTAKAHPENVEAKGAWHGGHRVRPKTEDPGFESRQGVRF